jgi:tetratricopeptide (TPR) repeat protein
MRHYEEAARSYRDALAAPAVPPPLRARASYNLGNALVRAAEEKPGDPVPLRAAIVAYEEALRLDPGDRDAKWNLEVALRRLGEDRTSGGSPGRGNRADYGRGNQQNPDYEGNPETAVGAMAGGGYGSAEGESAEELDESQARQLLEAVEKEELQSHQGRPATHGSAEGADW